MGFPYIDKRPVGLGKTHLVPIELLVAACNNFVKMFVVHKFRSFPKFAKIELLEIKGYTVVT